MTKLKIPNDEFFTEHVTVTQISTIPLNTILS